MLAALACAFAARRVSAARRRDAAAPTADARRRRAAAHARPTRRRRATKVDRFDADRAWTTLEYQVDLGPRPAGRRRASEQLAAYIKARLPGGHFEAVPGGLRNVVGGLPGKGKPILLAAHYDTRTSRASSAPTTAPAARRRCSSSRAALKHDQRAERDRRSGSSPYDGEEATDDGDFLRHGPARLQGVRAEAREADQGADRCSTSSPTRTCAIPREAELGRGDVGATCARPRRACRRGRRRSRTRRRARSRTTTRRSSDRGIPAIDLIDFDFPCWHKPCDDITRRVRGVAWTRAARPCSSSCASCGAELAASAAPSSCSPCTRGNDACR